MSQAERLSLLPEEVRKQHLSQFTPRELAALEYHWPFWARPKQRLPEGDYNIWLVLSGRGWGKTRTGAEAIRELVETNRAGRIALAAPTAADARDVIVEGNSGILNVFPPSDRPKYEPSKRRVTFKNGALAFLYSADEPERFRGPQHDAALCDELATWKYPEAYDMLQFGLRLGTHPICIITTTPKATPLIRGLVKDARDGKGVIITTGSTYENRANLSANFFTQMENKYEGTRLGLQELYAKILEDVEGALWNAKMIDDLRVKQAPEMKRIIVAIDPTTTSTASSDETGLIVVGLGADNHAYVLGDYSGKMSPNTWARKAVQLYHTFKADRIIAEVNNGGEMIGEAVRTVDRRVPFKEVRASKGKRTRAEPVAALYEQKKVHHVGVMQKLEEQMCSWDPIHSPSSPDRMDALVWGLSELMFTTRRVISASFLPPA